MKLTAKLEGLKGLEEALVELEQFSGRTTTGKNAVRRGMVKAMQPIEQGMAQRAPFDAQDRDGDGKHLRDTMKTQSVPAKRRTGAVEVMTGPAPVGRRARNNARFQEEGTVNMPANPYARPTADVEGPKVLDTVADLLRDEVMKSVARARKKAGR